MDLLLFNCLPISKISKSLLFNVLQTLATLWSVVMSLVTETIILFKCSSLLQYKNKNPLLKKEVGNCYEKER